MADSSETPAAGMIDAPEGEEQSLAVFGFAEAHELLCTAVASMAITGAPADAATLASLHALVDNVSAIIAEAEVRFDVFQLWRDRGAGSLRGWLADEVGLSHKEATRVSARVRRLDSWPEIGAAWVDGRLSGSQVDVIVATVPARFVDEFARQADHVVEVLAPLDVESTRLAMRQWVRRAENDDGPEQFSERRSGLHLDATFDGVQLTGHVSSAEAAVLQAAISDFDVPDAFDENGELIGEARTRGQRAVDALVAACRFAIDHREGASETGRFLPHMSLVVDLAELQAAALRGAGVRSVEDLGAAAEFHGWSAVERAWFRDALRRHGEGATIQGHVLDGAALGALSCDSVVQRILTAGSQVIDMGRSVRTATAAQRRAIIARDRHCRAPGCRTGPTHCEVHHLDHWVNGGATDVGRMVLLCGTHHRRFHQPGWKMQLEPDATFTVHAPAGWSRSTLPDRAECMHFDARCVGVAAVGQLRSS